MPVSFSWLLTASTQTPYDTAQNLINAVAVEVGLSESSDAWADTDANIVRMRRLLTKVGRWLWREYNWTQLTKLATLTTTQGVSSYPLPDDWGRMLDQTGWNRTTRLPMGGPLSAQEWQCLKGRASSIPITVFFRALQQQIYLYPDSDIAGGQVLAWEYMSRNWVMAQGDTTPSKSALTANTDVLWYDPELAISFLKLEFLKATGFDTTAAEDEAQRVLEAVRGDDTQARVLNLNSNTVIETIADGPAIPLTGFGQ